MREILACVYVCDQGGGGGMHTSQAVEDLIEHALNLSKSLVHVQPVQIHRDDAAQCLVPEMALPL